MFWRLKDWCSLAATPAPRECQQHPLQETLCRAAEASNMAAVQLLLSPVLFCQRQVLYGVGYVWSLLAGL